MVFLLGFVIGKHATGLTSIADIKSNCMNANMSILLVENSKEDQLFFLQALSAQNTPVEYMVTDNGFEALIALEDHHFDIIITDIHMPVMSAYEFIRLLNCMREHPPFVVYSKDMADSAFFYGAGAVFCFAKPSQLTAMTRIISAIIEGDFKSLGC